MESSSRSRATSSAADEAIFAAMSSNAPTSPAHDIENRHSMCVTERERESMWSTRLEHIKMQTHTCMHTQTHTATHTSCPFSLKRSQAVYLSCRDHTIDGRHSRAIAGTCEVEDEVAQLLEARVWDLKRETE